MKYFLMNILILFIYSCNFQRETETSGYALIYGVSDYLEILTNLNYPDDDARDLSIFFSDLKLRELIILSMFSCGFLHKSSYLMVT